jgi:hypothetical protein
MAINKVMRKIFTILFLICGLTLPAQTKWYVATTGSDSHGKGTYGDPWLTIKHAADTVTGANFDNDTISIGAGTFSEPAQITLGVKINIKGAGVTTIITTANALEPIIRLYSASEGTDGSQSISYIKIDGDSTAAIGISVYARSNVEIHHCTFTNFANVDDLAYGLFISGNTSGSDAEPTTWATGNKVHDCTFTDCAGDRYADPNYYAGAALSIGGQSGALVYDNTIDESTTGRHGYGIKTAAGGYNKGLKIYDNYIKTSVTRGVLNSWAFSIETWNSRGGMEIYGNTIVNGGIDLAGSEGTTDAGGVFGFAVKIYDNSISWDALNDYNEKAITIERNTTGNSYIYKNYVHNVAYVLAMYTVNGNTIEDIYVYYNIFNEIRKSSAGYTGRITMISLASGTATYHNLQFLNNVAYNSTQTMGTAFHFSTTGAILTNITVRNNIVNNSYYPIRFENSDVDVVSNENNNYHDCSTNAITYVSSTGTNIIQQNNSTITTDPLFVIPGSDFHLQSSSPAINAGLDVNLTSDYDGSHVGSSPDIGAYEYGQRYLKNNGKLEMNSGKLVVITR